MMGPLLYRALPVLSLAVFGLTLKPQIGIGAIFEPEDFKHNSRIFNKTFNENILLQRRNVSMFAHSMPSEKNVYNMFSNLCAFVEDKDVRSLLVVGNQRTIQTVGQVARPLGIPVVGYTTDKSVDKFVQIHNPLLLMMKPSKIDQAKAFLRFFEANFWFNIIVFVQETFIVDGFYDHIRVNSSQPKWSILSEIISEEMTNAELVKVLSSNLGNDPKIVVVHADLALAIRTFTIVKEANLTAINHAWFVTEASYTRHHDELEVFPAGTMAIIPNYAVRTDDVIVDGTNFMIKSVISVLNKQPVKRNCLEQNLNWLTRQGEETYSHMLKTVMNGLSGALNFGDQGQLKSYGFMVMNLVHEESQRFWRKVGHVKDDDVSPFGIIWPGESLSSNILQGKKKYRIVTNPVKPFIMDEYPHTDYGTCAKDTTCISINTTDKFAIIQALQDYDSGIMNESNPYQIKCCRGLSVDLLNRLSSDLDFDYSLYIVPDRTYGKEKNGSWNGMVRDLMSGTAHMAVAAFSITRERVKVIDFTSPYFFSGFSVLYTEKHRASNMQAFLEPFDVPVWFAILVSATFTAIAMGIFEWKSPFGLNPWGKKRKQNYTLASGMTMVYSVLFGHTVKTKSPKAWPSKVMQNFWAFCCIFVIASYTANLAAFIAGKHAGITFNNIQDSRLLDINVGVLPGSAVEGTVKALNPRLAKKCQQENATDFAINKLIYGGLDAYLGDYPILDYARAKLDPDCDLRLLKQTFGADSYGLGLPKGSPIKTPISKKIQEFHESGYVEDLIDVHFADSLCYKQRIKQEDSQLVVQHHAGSFVMLCVGIIVGILILFLEHGIYKWLVPRLRSKPGSSFWKSVHVMFFSQRLHRSVTSAELVPAHESCQALLGIVKNREFMRLFQKSTIKTDKMADAAKRKRLNRNFFDIVEKAKWMKEMSDNNLFGDDTQDTSAPQIKEINLRDITQAVDLTEFRKQNHINLPPSYSAVLSSKETCIDGEAQLTNNKSCLSVSRIQSFEESPDISPDDNSGDTLLSRKTKIDKTTGLKYSSVPMTTADDDKFTYASPVFDGAASIDVIDENVAATSNDNIYDVIDKSEHLEELSHIVPPRVPNGDILSDEYRPKRLSLSLPRGSEECKDGCVNNGNTSLNRHLSMSAAKFKDSRTFHPRKRQSIHGNRRDKASFDVDKFTKEELLLMWKSSELELSERLDAAVKDKQRLESKLSAMRLQTSTPV